MKWAIPQLSKYRQNGMPVDQYAQLDGVKSRNSEIRHITPVHVEGFCTFGAEQMNCHFRVTGELTLPCARTWEDVTFPIDFETDEIFRWGEMAGKDENDNIHPVSGDVIDVTPVLEELILLEIPMQVYKEDAKVIQPKNDSWSFLTEDELEQQSEKDEQKVDPRLADLAKYFDQTD
ncbi:YceD family protein [Kurthia sibirica]|uniref:Metal-binding protein n=1 Tax=Kurthia sibirica TaxID=202750 RepID=A0A2U3AQK3_9BACL|nr:YceD family protein [Kurthia sibirica]PWI26807.1 hypothetical protein DEX24_00480 [Kurthia sibirica]GEK32656.1 hypothetical protein KSI01_01890 [Kurthia sibirica]